ncbi:MAG: hypothetical protein ACXABY_23885 [Candidatus Thorarchaeota archaeon]|jgi:hypothetical protein
MDHLYNGEPNYRIVHRPTTRTIELLDFSLTRSLEPGRIVQRISEDALIELMLNYNKWVERSLLSPDDWWGKLLKAMELMGKLNEETSNKTGMLNTKAGY